MHRFSYVFADDPDPEDDVFFSLLDDTLTGLEAVGYHFELEYDGSSGGDSYQLSWRDEELRASAAVVKDRDSGLCYLVTTSAKRADAIQIARALDEQIGFLSLETLQQEASRGMVFHSDRLIRMAIGADRRPDSTSLKLIRQGFEHRSPTTRFHAAVAAGHTRWAELVPDLEELLCNEPDPSVRKAAHNALEGCLEAKKPAKNR